jgi:hypothetical protein
MDPEPVAHRARPRLGTASVLVLLLASAVRLTASDHLAVALLGALAAPLAALVAWQVAGPRAAPWAGVLIALSPIHTLASRAAGLEPSLVLLLLAALWLVLGLELEASLLRAIAVGFALGALVASGVAAFAAVAFLSLIWLTWRRRALGALSALAAVALVGVAALLGLARSPLDYGEIPAWIPETTLEGVARCAGASFTRVIGVEYQLLVPHARYVLPLTALFVALMLRGATRLPARPRGLLLAGASLPFALGAAMALIMGRVTPLQANRLLAALPFVALLTAAGLASLSGTRAWTTGTAVAGTLAAFLALALGR